MLVLRFRDYQNWIKCKFDDIQTWKDENLTASDVKDYAVTSMGVWIQIEEYNMARKVIKKGHSAGVLILFHIEG